MVQSIMIRKPRQQEHKAAGYIASTAKKQKAMNEFSACFLRLYNLGSQPRELYHPEWADISTSINLTEIILHRLAPR